MNRSIENRILGGVCGGLGAATPLSATVWRIVFALITAMTFGFGLLVYALWWWLIPQDTAGSEGGSIYSMLLAGGMSVILLGGWFLRERLVGPEGASLLLPFIVLIVGFVLLYKQITAPIGVPISPMSVVVMLAVAVAWMLSAIGLLPTVVQDALLRAAPALLIFLGLVWMLRQRLRWAVLVSLVLTILLAGAVVTAGLMLRRDRIVTPGEDTLYVQPVDDSINLLQFNIAMLEADIELISALPGQRSVIVTYNGPDNRALRTEYAPAEDGTSTLNLVEASVSQPATIGDIGRGLLRIELPQNLATALVFKANRSRITLDAANIALEWLDIEVGRGDLVLTMPDYLPQSPSVLDRPGRIRLYQGNVRLRLPDTSPYVFELVNAPQVVPGDAYVLSGETLQPQIRSSERAVQYIVQVPGGELRIDTTRLELIPTPIRSTVAP